jgi:MYXO-CTERM domain-containing protein
VQIFGSWGNGEFGRSLAAGTGFAGGGGTIWAGAPNANPMAPSAGAVLVLHGPTLEAIGPEIWTEEMPGIVLGDHADGHTGEHVAMGDFDGDGDPDVAISEPYYFHGSTYVLRSAVVHDDDGDGWPSPLADCDDGADWVHPYAPEDCDGRDSDCDGDVPEEEIDHDGDQWLGCDGDCDPYEPGINPDAEEVCDDGEDNDCDGAVDEDDDECGDPGDDDDDATDDDDDAGVDDDDHASGFRCECHLAPSAPATGALGLLLLGAALLLRRR